MPHMIDETCCKQRHCNLCDKYRKELEQYQAIGTLEELQTAMKFVKLAKIFKTAAEIIDSCAEYEDLEEQGRLIKLPFSMRDTIYELQKHRQRIQPLEIYSITYENSEIIFRGKIVGKGVYGKLAFDLKDMNEIVFLSKEEAEQALQELIESEG